MTSGVLIRHAHDRASLDMREACIQIIDPEFEDRTPLTFARRVEREFGGFVAPPGYA